MIHGTVYSGRQDNKYRYDLKNFFFTYAANVPKKSPMFKVIRHDIQLMIAQRDWIINESDDIIEIDKVSKSLVEILLSIVSIGLSRLKEYLTLSINLIEILLPLLESQVDPKYRRIVFSPDKRKIRLPINLLRSGRLRTILNDCYINISRIFIEQKKYKEAEEVLMKGLAAGADRMDCYSAMALTYYYMDNLEAAEEYTKKIAEIEKDHPIYLVNMAFFSIRRKEYSRVTNYYRLLRNKIKSQNKHIISQTLKFLNDRKKKEPEEFAYSFATGILTYNFIDKEIGTKELRRFIKNCENDVIYKNLILTSKKILRIN